MPFESSGRCTAPPGGVIAARFSEACSSSVTSVFSSSPWPRSRYIASVGTSVRDNTYDAITANTTDSASGTKRYRATPLSMNIGTNTMQIHSDDTKAGTAIWLAPFRMPSCSFSPRLR